MTEAPSTHLRQRQICARQLAQGQAGGPGMIIRAFIELAALAVFLTAAAIWLPVFMGV